MILYTTKILRLKFWIYFKKYLIVINENINENIIDEIIKSEKSKLFDCDKLSSPKIDTAAKVGIDNKKDIFAESYLLNFKNLAPVIVIPDLLTPGIKDNICINPIHKAAFKVKLELISFWELNLSLK